MFTRKSRSWVIPKVAELVEELLKKWRGFVIVTATCRPVDLRSPVNETWRRQLLHTRLSAGQSAETLALLMTGIGQTWWFAPNRAIS